MNRAKSLTIIFLLAIVSLAAQDTVEIPVGTVSLRRIQKPAVITAKVSYTYFQKSNSSQVVVYGESLQTDAPAGDSLQSVFPPSSYEASVGNVRSTRTKGKFGKRRVSRVVNWSAYMQSVGYYFDIIDSTRSDSVTFDMLITKKGKVKIVWIPGPEMDSLNLMFAQKVSARLRNLRSWEPASISRDGFLWRSKRINTMIRLTVYASDPAVRGLLQMEVK
ncbi:MAG TPA: hypothetical protein VI731_03415 [Bacteroidia bacterium]|nr:hypothetical protein [Bacteroidia bacterium]